MSRYQTSVLLSINDVCKQKALGAFQNLFRFCNKAGSVTLNTEYVRFCSRFEVPSVREGFVVVCWWRSLMTLLTELNRRMRNAVSPLSRSCSAPCRAGTERPGVTRGHHLIPPVSVHTSAGLNAGNSVSPCQCWASWNGLVFRHAERKREGENPKRKIWKSGPVICF